MTTTDDLNPAVLRWTVIAALGGFWWLTLTIVGGIIGW